MGLRNICLVFTVLALVPVSSPGQSGSGSFALAPDVNQTLIKSVNDSLGITLDVKDSTLESVLRMIVRQAGLRIVLDNTSDVFQRPVTLKLSNESLPQALNSVLKGTNLTAQIMSNGKTVVVREGSGSSDSITTRQIGGIRGKVVDSATGKGLPGVSVALPGSGLSTLSSETGNFVFRDVPVGTYSAMFRLVGYRSSSQSVTVDAGEQSSLVASLPAMATMLSGVVTSVTGTQKKIEVGNDITVIDVDEVLRTAPVNNVTDILEGRVPGLTVIRSSGVPGAPSKIRLRGLGGGLLANREGAPTNDPIIVVDGIRIYASQSGVTDQNLAMASSGDSYSSDFPPSSPLDQIDPNSIETIEVLKGPSASALYGSDAANGVIIITTKRGQTGRTRWSLSTNQSLEYLPGFYAEPGYYPFCSKLRAAANDKPPEICESRDLHNSLIDSVVRFQALSSDRLTAFGTGYGNSWTGQFSGGNQAITYSVTGSMIENLGLLKVPGFYQDLFRQVFDSSMTPSMKRPNLLKSRSISANIVMEPKDEIRVRLSSSITNQARRQSTAQLQLSTLASSYIDTNSVSPSSLIDFATRVNSDAFTLNNSMSADFRIWELLPLTTTLGFSRNTRDDKRLLPRGVGVRYDSLGFYSTGTLSNNTSTFAFNGILMPGNRISVALGANFKNDSKSTIQVRSDSLTRGVVSPSRIDYATQNKQASATGGWFVEPRLNISSRFFANPGFRFDGNSLSGTRSGIGNGLWSLFPKLNFSWVAIDPNSNSPYLGIVSLLRPRISIGVAGVQPAPGWQLRLMSPTDGTTNFSGGIDDGGLVVSTLGNTQLRPERTREIEGGFDVELWDARLEMSLTSFVKIRKDAIQDVPIAGSVYGGKLRQYLNIGEIRNTGIEMDMKTVLVDSRLMRWDIAIRLSKYSNKLVSLSSDEPYIDLGNATRLVPGYPVNGRWVRPLLGYATPSAGGRLSKTDVIVGDSAVYVGQQMPRFELPLNTNLSLFAGKLSLSAALHYKDGLTQFNSGSRQLLNNVYLNPRANLSEQAAAIAADPQCGTGHCTLYGLIQEVSSLRFQSLSIGYNVPRELSERFRVPSLSLALQGSNLGLWTNYRGKDPDVNGSMVGDITQDDGQLPQPRSWRVQVRLGN